MSLENLKTAVSAIKDDNGLPELVSQYCLKQVDRASQAGNILSEHTGMVDGVPVLIRFIWHDPSQAFSIQPDINKIELVVGGQVVASASYEETL